MISADERPVTFKILLAVPSGVDAAQLDSMLQVIAGLLSAEGGSSVRYVDGRWSAPGLGLKTLPSTGTAKVLAFGKKEDSGQAQQE